MNKYQPKVTGTVKNGFFALVVRIDADGQENVLHAYKGRHFSTKEAGIKSTTKYINTKC